MDGYLALMFHQHFGNRIIYRPTLREITAEVNQLRKDTKYSICGVLHMVDGDTLLKEEVDEDAGYKTT